MINKIDRRILKSQKAIQSTFLSMLIKDGFDEITVKKITEQADISRKTFYLHYLDKYDLLDTIINKKLEELEEICEQKKEKGFIEGTVIWFNYFDENKDFFSALFSSKSTVSFRKQLLDFMMNQLSKKINNLSADKDPEILLRFLSMAVLGILESFILNELNSSTEEIAKQVGELLLQNISLSSH
ncbi:MAG: TetR/AcrR family transcriptional regulator C-terminal domain-containing protein [Clostridium baratii]|uniref:TetR/AcrR family transcriptional regulator C-terminal domain-containing protein n=1 Tax=Clostridium baratii TaxID=1561 RepID=UPI0006C4B50E|nr:TetR/AcrR family transcriptional regulator C-terminal domain-containing protein [Clostridium baratii]MBS6007628.1 TetR/AcrR family transcriptional regulator C-terminal domain-containing protein [Clostridium baratii]MDU4911603.1 TetR/AcrR family transcriptional regulator C-terminal domain-containing protein [Clostridium baratii]CUP60833.1 transcriptional regulator%2C TetR family [Clostridium baratii]